MKVYFLLPSSGQKVSGGFKVIYEYAAGLTARGMAVEIIHPANADRQAPWLQKVWRLWRWLERSLTGSWKPRWFQELPEGRGMTWRTDLRLWGLKPGDVVVYSSWLTAEWAPLHANTASVRQFYIVHDYEHFMVAGPGLQQRILDTYRQGMSLVVTSPAGRELVARAGREPDFEIPNGIDVAKFCPPVNESERTRIGFPARPETFKGTQDALEAVHEIHQEFGGRFSFWAFGPYDGDLPDWIEWSPYLTDDNLIRHYQETLVFVTASHYEGWGLPGSEAMACGAALVSTDHGGVRAYAVHGKNALLSPIRDSRALAENLRCLLVDASFRAELSTNGLRTMQSFTRELSLEKFAQAVLA